MAAQSAALSSQRLVSRTGKPQRGCRLRKTTIVALARKLLVALWKYVTAGVVIEGVTMKVA
jgi:transposase